MSVIVSQKFVHFLVNSGKGEGSFLLHSTETDPQQPQQPFYLRIKLKYLT